MRLGSPRDRDEHPSIVYVREDALLPLLEEWLLGFFAPDGVGATVDALEGADQPYVGDTARRSGVIRPSGGGSRWWQFWLQLR
jgi:hypothetical protein